MVVGAGRGFYLEEALPARCGCGLGHTPARVYHAPVTRAGTTQLDEQAARLVLITAPDQDCALRLARALIEARLAACVNLVNGVTSVYRWQGAIEEAREVLMLVKTTGARLPALEARLIELHPYDVPECVALAPSEVEARYLKWLRTETAPASDAASDPTSDPTSDTASDPP